MAKNSITSYTFQFKKCEQQFTSHMPVRKQISTFDREGEAMVEAGFEVAVEWLIEEERPMVEGTMEWSIEEGEAMVAAGIEGHVGVINQRGGTDG